MDSVTRSLFDEEHGAFRESVRKFLAQRAVPLLDDWRSGSSPSGLLAAAGEEGIIGTNAGEDVGGGGVADPRFVVVLVEELVAIGATGLAHVVALHCGISLPFVDRLPRDRFGGLLANMASGRAIVVPVVSSDAAEHSVIHGVAGGAIASAVILFDPVDGSQSVLMADDLDVRVVEDALGGTDCRQADLARREQTPCALGAGPIDVDAVTASHHLWMAVLAASGARQALQLAGSYVRDRKVFGRPLASFENTRLRLAELHAELDAVQRQVDKALEADVEGRLTPVGAASALLCARGTHDRAVDQALQFHGGYGYMREYPISHAFADAQYLRHSDGALADPREVVARWLETEWVS